MTSLTVNIESEQEERVLLAFLNSLKYNYKTDLHNNDLTDTQKKEILRRENDFKSGKIKSEPWEDVKKRFSL